MKLRISPLVLSFIIATAGPVFGQSNYPERSIRLLYGFPPGNDTPSRIFSDKLAEAFGKPVIVENVTGAAGNIAADRAASAAPDGYTLGMLTGANIVLRPLLSSKPYDPLKDLVPISVVWRFTNVIAVNNNVPAKTLAELVALARATPGKLTFGHNGVGSVTHLSGELLKDRAKIDVQGVPYRGPSAILTDLVGGRIAMTINPPSSTLPLVQAGHIRGLAVTSLTRTAFAPDLPTVAESGYPGFETMVWFGLFAPAGTPRVIVDRLSRET